MERHASASADVTGLVERDRVHGRIYTDPAIFDAEMDRIFHKGWVFVGHESEVPNPGDFRTRDIGRQPVIMVRGDDGLVRVLMNRCTHRGAAVCSHEQGNAKTFVCPYHGWSFHNTGELGGVPSPLHYGADFDRSKFALREAPCVDSYRGIVFASLSADVPTLDEHLGPHVKAQIDIACDLSPTGEFEIRSGVHKYGYDGNWKLQLENSVDGYHLGFLHRGYFQLVKARTGRDMGLMANSSSPARSRSFGNGHVSWDFEPANRAYGQLMGTRDEMQDWQRSYVDAMVAAHGAERTEFLLGTGLAHVLIFPNLVIIGAHLRMLRPLAVDRTEVFLFPAMLKDVPEQVNRQRLVMHEAFYGPAGGGATDDLEVFERTNIGLRATVDPWLDLSRGLGREKVEPDGTVTGHISDELCSRSVLQHWYRRMTAAAQDVAFISEATRSVA